MRLVQKKSGRFTYLYAIKSYRTEDGKSTTKVVEKFGLDPRKTASILDTFSCLVQGLIPYGAQILMASGLSGMSGISIVGFMFYPFMMGAFAILSIIFRYPRKYS